MVSCALQGRLQAGSDDDAIHGAQHACAPRRVEAAFQASAVDVRPRCSKTICMVCVLCFLLLLSASGVAARLADNGIRLLRHLMASIISCRVMMTPSKVPKAPSWFKPSLKLPAFLSGAPPGPAAWIINIDFARKIEVYRTWLNPCIASTVCIKSKHATASQHSAAERGSAHSVEPKQLTS